MLYEFKLTLEVNWCVLNQSNRFSFVNYLSEETLFPLSKHLVLRKVQRNEILQTKLVQIAAGKNVMCT